MHVDVGYPDMAKVLLNNFADTCPNDDIVTAISWAQQLQEMEQRLKPQKVWGEMITAALLTALRQRKFKSAETQQTEDSRAEAESQLEEAMAAAKDAPEDNFPFVDDAMVRAEARDTMSAGTLSDAPCTLR